MKFQRSRRLLGVCYIVVKVNQRKVFCSFQTSKTFNWNGNHENNDYSLSNLNCVFIFVAGVLAGCHGDRLVPTDLWLVARHLLTGKTIMQSKLCNWYCWYSHALSLNDWQSRLNAIMMRQCVHMRSRHLMKDQCLKLIVFLFVFIENTEGKACPLLIAGDVWCDSERQGAEFWLSPWNHHVPPLVGRHGLCLLFCLLHPSAQGGKWGTSAFHSHVLSNHL